MEKTILLPLDLGVDTLALFEYAEPIAARMEAGLLLLHVIHKQSYDNGTFDSDTGVHQSIAREGRFILNQLSRQALTHGICARVLVVDGNPAEAILQTAKAHHVDLILLGQSCGGASRTSADVSASAPCPVLTRRGSHAPEAFHDAGSTAASRLAPA